MHAIAEKIKSIADRAPRVEPVPEWGVTLHFHTLEWPERREFFKWTKANKDEDGAHDVRLLIMSARDEVGAPVFSDADAEWLARKNPGVIQRLVTSLLKINGMTDSAIEDARKNSETTRSEISS